MRTKKRGFYFRVIALSLILIQCRNSDTVPQLGKNSIKEVIAVMTPQEKAMLLVGADPGFPRGYPSGFGGADTLFDSQPPVVGATRKVVPGAAGNTHAIPRLGIPSLVLADGPAGVRIDPNRQDTNITFYATAFPIETMLASTWDTTVVSDVGKAMGNEALEYGVDILLAPALNIHRNPLGGRNFEYYSEDPLVSGLMAAAFVNGVQSNGVGTSLKHYAANNNETNRMNIDVQVDQKALHEIYLKGFGLALAYSKPWTVMSAYNKINGTYCSENSYLLRQVLRDEFGFNGATMTDWFGGRNYLNQIKAGTNILMPGSSYIVAQFAEAIKNGDLDEKVVNKAIEEILSVVMKSPKFKDYKYSNTPDLELHSVVSKDAAIEGAVLLENRKNTLPIDKTGLHKVALFGIGSYETIPGGTGSGSVNSAYSISVLQGLQKAGFTIPEKLIQENIKYIQEAKKKAGQKDWYFAPDIRLEEKAWKLAYLEQSASECDIAILTLRRTSGEFSDRALKNDFELSDTEKDLVKNLSSSFHKAGKKLVVLLNIGGVIETTSWNQNADAILNIWQPGQEGGNAVADLLLGKADPSGKLTMTFPKKYTDVPSAALFPNPKDNPQSAIYSEGTYVGYRNYLAKNIEPQYEFGYGLSYTHFNFSDFKLVADHSKGIISVAAKVTNVGNFSGKEVLQLYVKTPQNKYLELKAFKKTRLLKPGEAVLMEISININDLRDFNPHAGGWVLVNGNYEINLGTSCKNIIDTKEVEL